MVNQTTVFYKATFPLFQSLAPFYEKDLGTLKQRVKEMGEGNENMSDENRVFWKKVADAAVFAKVTETIEIIES